MNPNNKYIPEWITRYKYADDERDYSDPDGHLVHISVLVDANKKIEALELEIKELKKQEKTTSVFKKIDRAYQRIREGYWGTLKIRRQGPGHIVFQYINDIEEEETRNEK